MNGKKYLFVILILAISLRLTVSWALFFSILSIIAIWFLAKQLFPKLKWMKEVSALFLAISPWHISLINYSWKISLAVFIAILGTMFLIKYLKNKWIFILLAALILIIGYLIKPFAIELSNAKDVIWLTDQQRREHGQNYDDFSVKLFHNKVINYGLSSIEHYSDYFTGDFLFFSGKNKMYLFDILLLFIGFISLVNKPGWNKWGVVLIWLIVAPINSIFTFSPPDSLGSALMIVPLILISSFGAVTLSKGIYVLAKGCTIKK